MPVTRVAAIYDIHGNLPALEAVIDEIRHADVDQVIVGGDVVPGPMPRETLACLLDLDIPIQFIHGNSDREVLAQMTGTETPWYRNAPEQWREPVRWTAQQLDIDHERLLAAWPPTCRVEIRGLGETLFCHATPRNDTDCFTRLTPEDRLVPIFEAVNAPVVVCGHTHMPFDRTIGRVRVVNAGSVGMPFGEAGADWLLLGPDVELRHTNYDATAAADRMRATDYPDAEDYVAQYVIKQPSAAEMLDLFTRVSLQ